FLTCSDQLHTPRARGGIVTAVASRCQLSVRRSQSPSCTPTTGLWQLATRSGSRGRLDGAAEGSELGAVLLAGFVEGLDLLGLQLGDFLGAGPDDRPAGVVGLVRELERLLRAAAEHLLQDVEDELEGVVVVVFEDHVVRRDAPGVRVLAGGGLC